MPGCPRGYGGRGHPWGGTPLAGHRALGVLRRPPPAPVRNPGAGPPSPSCPDSPAPPGLPVQCPDSCPCSAFWRVIGAHTGQAIARSCALSRVWLLKPRPIWSTPNPARGKRRGSGRWDALQGTMPDDGGMACKLNPDAPEAGSRVPAIRRQASLEKMPVNLIWLLFHLPRWNHNSMKYVPNFFPFGIVAPILSPSQGLRSDKTGTRNFRPTEGSFAYCA